MGQKRKKRRNYGHLKGVDTVEKIVKASLKLKIPIVTFYVFHRNWQRPKGEIHFLFKLIGSYFKKEIKNVIKNGIKVNILGKTSSFSLSLKKILNETVKKTKNNKKRLIVNLALNYGSKNEIKNALIKLKKNRSKITEKEIGKNLYTAKQPDPDILIRTGGQKRLSNFMLWQLAYSELYFLNKLWPDFNANDLKKLLKIIVQLKGIFGKI